ncbi:G-protein coupled receptor GRL101-like [Saccostrea cucullata]|uniref:G-protein coupled receptor GRL101-like n=1 Tax=Saccostrea cuccullata TaxID=36930 RepID=UPI002ED51C67
MCRMIFICRVCAVCLTGLILAASQVSSAEPVDCDFSKDTCSWKSVKVYKKGNEKIPICGLNGNISHCLSPEKYVGQITWTRMKIGDLAVDEIKSGFRNLESFVFGFVDTNVIIPGLDKIRTSFILSENLQFSNLPRSLHYQYFLYGSTTLTVSYLTDISLYESKLIAAHGVSSSGQTNITKGCVDLPFEADVKIVFQGVFQGRRIEAVLLSEVAVKYGLCNNADVDEISKTLKGMCKFAVEDCISSGLILPNTQNSTLNTSLCPFCEGKNFSVSNEGLPSSCFCKGDEEVCHACRCSNTVTSTFIKNLKCNEFYLESATKSNENYAWLHNLNIELFSLSVSKNNTIFNFDKSRKTSLFISVRGPHHFIHISEGTLSLIMDSTMNWYIINNFSNSSVYFSTTFDYFYFAQNNLSKATHINVGNFKTVVSTNFSNCNIPNHTRLSIDSRMVDLSGNKLTSFVISQNTEFLYIKNNMLSDIVKNYANLDQLQYYPLSILDISFNKISKIRREDFSYYVLLVSLNLSGNLIEHIDVDIFSDLTMLVSIDLSENKISRIQREHFRSLSQLRYLYIQKNDIFSVSSDIFHGLVNMRYLQVESFSICCAKPQSMYNIECVAPVNELSSCDYLIAVPILNVAIWYMALFALFGNLTVLFYNAFHLKSKTQTSYLILTINLSCADLLMGVYLFIIAIVNLDYTGRYGLMDYTWRHSYLCILAGIIATVSSEASVFTVFLITVDRFLAIKYTISEKRITKKGAIFICFCIWTLSLLIATLPLLPFPTSFFNEFYSQSGVCISLPLSVIRKVGWQYSMIIFVGLNTVLFIGILSGQIAIFVEALKIGKDVRTSKIRDREISLAKTLIAIVITDMFCWIPVGIIGTVTFFGTEVSIEVYAWIIVLVLPINSALNPILYTLTSVVRQKGQLHMKRLTQENMLLRKQLDTLKSSSSITKQY